MKKGKTALIYIAEKNNTDIVKLFIIAKASLDIKDNRGKTVLDYACYKKTMMLLNS